MKVTFHLNTGGTVELDLESTQPIQEAQRLQVDGWLWDSHGAGVDLSAVVAIVPGSTASGDPIYPDEITDGDGDVWRHVGNGEYMRGQGAAGTHSFSYIKENWGIKETGE